MQRLLLLALGLILTLAIGSSLAEAAGRNTGSRSAASASRNERKPRFNKNARRASAALSPRQLGSAYSILQGLHRTGARLILRSKALAERQDAATRQVNLAPKTLTAPSAAAPVAVTPEEHTQPEPTAAALPAAELPSPPVAAPEPVTIPAPDPSPQPAVFSEPVASPEPEASREPEPRAPEPAAAPLPPPAPDPAPEPQVAEDPVPEPQAPADSAEPAKPPVPGPSAEQLREAAAEVARVPKLRSHSAARNASAEAPAGPEAAPEPEAASPPAEIEAAEDKPQTAAANSLDQLAQAGTGADKPAETPAADTQPEPAAETEAEPRPAEPAELKVRSFGLGSKKSEPAAPQGTAEESEAGSRARSTADTLLDSGNSESEPQAEEASEDLAAQGEKSASLTESRSTAPERAMPALPPDSPQAPESHPDQHTHEADPADLPGSETEGQPSLSRPRLAAESLSPRRAEALLPPLEDPSLQAQLEPASGGLGSANSSVQLNAMLTPLPSLRNLAISPMLGGPGGRPIEAPTEIVSHFGAPRMRPGQVPRDLVSLERGNNKRKLVALTFDDGPHPEYTSQLLAVLEHYDVRASFEMVGVQMVRYPQWVKMTHLAGHEIASHTYDHFRLPKLPYEEKVYQIDENQRLVEQLTGETPRFLRPPGGQLDPETQRICQQRGIVVAMWDVGLNDLKSGRSSKDLVSTALKETRAGSILLAHDGSQAMIDALPEIIEGLRGKGFEFVTLTELASQL